MTIPVWSLLGFATWTVLLLIWTVGVYRLSRVFSGRAGMAGFPADHVEGADWYRRSMRAHANCVENLPVFAAVVLAVSASGASGPAVNGFSMIILAARVIQSLIHVSVPQTDAVVAARFGFFFVQLIGFLALIVIVVLSATRAS